MEGEDNEMEGKEEEELIGFAFTSFLLLQIKFESCFLFLNDYLDTL